MSNREIIELANIIAERPCDSKDCAPCIRMGRRCNDYLKAERAIKAGYRKQSEGERIPHRFDKNGRPISWYCSNCRGIGDHSSYCSHCGAKMKGGE